MDVLVKTKCVARDVAKLFEGILIDLRKKSGTSPVLVMEICQLVVESATVVTGAFF